MSGRLLVREQQLPPLRPGEIGDALARVVLGIHLNGLTLHEAGRTFKKRYIECALRECGGNKSAAARSMGVHRNTLDRDIKELKIRVWEFNLPGTRRQQRKQLYASKERTVPLGGDHSGRSALAPGSAETTQPYSVRKGGRGDSPEQPRDGREVASASTAHLAKSSKPPRGFTFADFQFEDPDLQCGGVKA
jgi:hypothetical protein